MIRFSFVVIVTLLLYSCGMHPRVQFESGESISGNGDLNVHHKKIRGAGNIEICLDGQRYNGSIDMVWERRGYFQADIYSPFGGIVASILADSISGLITMGQKVYRFELDQVMDSLPFNWGAHITCKDFIRMLSGQVPELISNDKMGDPDSVSGDRKKLYEFWRDGETQICYSSSKKTTIVQSVELKYIGDEPWVLRLSAFENKLVRTISLRDDNFNYFSIRYERLKPE